ncbi:hypothetical protein [Rhizobium sp. BK456]|uniref:glycine-rich domain-containing protein n=1 Tax=Rhizobium sp. BK456 TaxID=2587007 RepID=UPI001616A129|nr:hypothetical protein [Rhizobium sp. BK456]MBB3520997.1 hypothetical protein [Rhizobium sp. BK456]
MMVPNVIGFGGSGHEFTADDLLNLEVEALETAAGSEDVIVRITDGLRLLTTRQILAQTLSAAGTLTGTEKVVLRTASGLVETSLALIRSFVSLDPTKIRIKKRLLTRLSDGGDHWMWTASGTANRQIILDIVKANFLTAAEQSLAIAEHIDCKLWVCSGGGGGGYNHAQAFGGHPGNLTIREFKLSDVPTASWSFQVGAGGSGGNVGGASYFGPNGSVCHAFSQGGWPGGQGTANQGLFYELMKSYGADRVLATHLGDTANDWTSNAPHGWVGPGGGGSQIWALRRGGNGSMGSKVNFRQGSVESSTVSTSRTYDAPKGQDHNPLYADSWGAGGGVGVGATVGPNGPGAGGFPGGGGGGSNTTNQAQIAWGAAGAIKIQFWLTTIEVTA